MNRARRFAVLSVISIVAAGAGCTPSSTDKQEPTNFVQAGDPTLLKTIGDSENQFTVLGSTALKNEVKNLETPIEENSLAFGMPFRLLNKKILFGSVITAVSDSKNENLGDIKLSEIPPVQLIATVEKKDATHSSLVFSSETHEKAFELPVLKLDPVKRLVYVDLAPLGKELDLKVIFKEDPLLDQYKSKSSRTARFDYSNSTLVFDVESVMTKLNSTDENEKDLTITNRWYWKLEPSSSNPLFLPRPPAEGVGFFTTQVGEKELINRWDSSKTNNPHGIKYYIKHVPNDYQPFFAAAFDEWNRKLFSLLGKNIFDYEFITNDDPRNDRIIIGDVRYNVVEWDLLNKAHYGGLGPSIANPATGELFQASVLIQGPTIIDLYSKWFQVQTTAAELRKVGKDLEAEALIIALEKEVEARVASNQNRVVMKLGNLSFQVRSQTPPLQDPMSGKGAFDDLPAGFTFKTYMAGYFQDMLAHELGHNLGLRHNFRGNLGATAEPSLGRVSRSVMEYLDRNFRHLDRIGEYDLMAMAYGMKGRTPQHKDWFCTDEDSDPSDASKSAECSSKDATPDPFAYHTSRLNRVGQFLVGAGNSEAPLWNLKELQANLGTAVQGMAAYAISAEKTSSSWTNFFGKEGRPQSTADVKKYVLTQISGVLCGQELLQAIAAKGSAEAREKATQNLSEFRVATAEMLKAVFSPQELACRSE